ncbi:hypothetical protein Pmani_015521 [Petrolisthes manimaculis]|uniref:Uncharacterized protein n=1 Tax=Petrolisthes manimaculis TaxID=1843537 RepID=A0AAE1PTL0_9EUCA|nr:hypothetical protein Pmani_015521 [Petrolisthes manimaculis]
MGRNHEARNASHPTLNHESAKKMHLLNMNNMARVVQAGTIPKTATGTQRAKHPGTFVHPVVHGERRGSPLVVSDEDDDDHGSLDSGSIAEKDVGGCTLSLPP